MTTLGAMKLQMLVHIVMPVCVSVRSQPRTVATQGRCDDGWATVVSQLCAGPVCQEPRTTTLLARFVLTFSAGLLNFDKHGDRSSRTCGILPPICECTV